MPDPGLAPAPARGEVVRVRTRTWLVEAVDDSPAAVAATAAGHGTVLHLACLDDDAQGRPLSVIWELELDTAILGSEAWRSIGARGFDPPRAFGAFLHTLRWNCVTATDPRLFQAPFRAGIRVDAYQLEPLRKALLLPRVNLFIADDVGLGKTIEAGLIAVELLLRRRAREVVVACPPSMLLQWKEEMETRFGLLFEILDRAYLERVRRERGYGTNPWTTFPRFLVSHRLLIDETYAAPLRAWLDNLRPASLLILDEAHHAAPASGARYAIDSRITAAIRDLAPRFEHRLFLSATPHNGHSNSFSALLELLDGNRFVRGIPVVRSNLESVMVRRLKEDVRQVVGELPERVVKQIDLPAELGIPALPADAPELRLSELLDHYRALREGRLAGLTRRRQAEAKILISGLQQRLLSSIEAFARTLSVHRRTMEKFWAAEAAADATAAPATADSSATATQLALLRGSYEEEDERALLGDEEREALEAEQIEASSAATAGGAGAGAVAEVAAERRLLAELSTVADAARSAPDARIRYLVDWIRRHQCPGARLPGTPCPAPGAPWTDLRVLVFTEYEDTRRYLAAQLRAAVADTHLDECRIEVFHGPTPPDARERIKQAFNLPPSEHPVRILIATDAAREGLNLQAHCWNLFHFDVPWNPSRLEQRNGRIDRKLQPAERVFCHYFVYTQRPEDRILKALVTKTRTIRHELGSLSPVLEGRLADALKFGIRRAEIDRLEQEIGETAENEERRRTVAEELEAQVEGRQALEQQIAVLRRRINEARAWIGYDPEQLRAALSCSLELMGAGPLRPVSVEAAVAGPTRFALPELETHGAGDGSWAETLDALRIPPRDGIRGFQWRRHSPVRPLVLEAPRGIDDDVVQVHLEHRVVKRLLSRFLAQGFVHHDLSRACLAQTRDAVPRVILLGRAAIYGKGAARLHEQILTVTAKYVEPTARKVGLTPYGREAEAKTLELLEEALRRAAADAGGADGGADGGAGTGAGAAPARGVPAAVQKRLVAAVPRDVSELLPVMEERAETLRAEVEAKLAERGRVESESMRKILDDQRRRITTNRARAEAEGQQRELWPEAERRQMESNRRAWQRWLENVDGDLVREPKRIREFYTVASFRVDPIGVVYLWPETG
ncbi:MAG: helicase [Planctomycetes bacterium]|nr:helicase [Planctomycetota bacterium]